MTSPNANAKATRFGDYLITGRLGEGGMCIVFRARKDGDREDVALKLLKEERRKDPQIVDLFVTEADLAMLLQHPNLVRTFDAGETQGRYYIAMELIEGANVSEIVSECARVCVDLPPDVAMFIVNEVLEGLDAVHRAVGHSGERLALVHRDVTPHNIFISFHGRVILGDLGIVQIGAYGEAEHGVALGKLGYLSPEQASAEPIDHRSDLFSLGVVLFELLTGTRLYAGEDERNILAKIAEAKAPKLRKVNPRLGRGLEVFVAKALARRPKDRFLSAEEMAMALEPHWSSVLANPNTMSGFLCGLFRDRARDVLRRRAHSVARG